MAPPIIGLWTPAQVTRLMDAIRQAGSQADIPKIVRQIMPGLPQTDLSYQIQRGLQLIGDIAAKDSATIGSHAVDALEFAQESVPEATQQLVNVVNVGGQHARAAVDAIKQMPPSIIASCVRQFGSNATVYTKEALTHLGTLAQSGSVAAKQALQALVVDLGTLAESGDVAAKQALEEIEENPGLYSTAATAAAAILQTIAGAAAAISATTLMIGAAVVVSVGLVAGYIWSQSGDRPIEPVQRRPNPPNVRPEPPPPPPSSSLGANLPVDISGAWRGSGGSIYSFSQNGTSFTWTRAGSDEVGTGTISGTSVSASYRSSGGYGSSGGSIALGANGRPAKISWSNGDYFTKQ